MENLITIQKLKDGTTARSMLTYETFDEALSALYSTMASATANHNVIEGTCLLMTDMGMIDKQEIYERPQDNPVEEAE